MLEEKKNQSCFLRTNHAICLLNMPVTNRKMIHRNGNTLRELDQYFYFLDEETKLREHR